MSVVRQLGQALKPENAAGGSKILLKVRLSWCRVGMVEIQ